MSGVAVSLPINLGQFLKVAGVAGSGGNAKSLIASGGVLVNGKAEQRRGHKLQVGDIVEVSGAMLRVEERASTGKEAPDDSRGRPGA